MARNKFPESMEYPVTGDKIKLPVLVWNGIGQRSDIMLFLERGNFGVIDLNRKISKTMGKSCVKKTSINRVQRHTVMPPLRK